MVGPPGLPLFEGVLLIPNSGLNSGPVRGRSGASDLSNDPRLKVVRNRSFLLQSPIPKKSESTSCHYSSNLKSLSFSSSQAGGLSIIPVAFSNSKFFGSPRLLL